MKTTSHNTRPIIGLIFVIIAAFSFSIKAIIIKVAYGYGTDVTPLSLMSLRMLFSLPFFIIAIVLIERNGDYPPLTTHNKVHLIGLGIIGYYLASYLDFLGLHYISASLERLVLLLYPTLVILLSALFLKRTITTREQVALVISYLGIVTVFYNELVMAGANIILGAALVMASATAFAIYLMGSGEIMKTIGPMRFTAYAMTIACCATLIHFGLVYDAAVTTFSVDIYGLALLMAVVSTVIPAFLMSAGIHHLGAGPAAIISSLGPISTIFIAYLILGEQLTIVQFLGAMLVITGVFVISRQKSPAQR